MLGQEGMDPVHLLVGVAAALLVFFVLLGVRYIPNDRVGVVEKRWSARGSVQSGLIALRGEAGFQPWILRGGMHWLMPLQYRVHRMPLVTITQGSIGYVFARDGAPLEPIQALASNVRADDFTDVATFLGHGGQRGPQRKVLREGTYAVNLAQFVVVTYDKVYFLPLNREEDEKIRRMAGIIGERAGFAPVVIKGADDLLGIVTVHDGPSLPQGEIIAPVCGEDPTSKATYHNNFQDPERFLAAGGQRGRQLQVLVEGTYYINRLFATVETIPKTVVEVGTVGVVVSYTGERGADLSGAEYKHGELVAKNTRGVWNEALLPGKYAFNTYAGKVLPVPTVNFILKWNKGEVGSHRYDENLSEVSLITKDAFEPLLPLSVVVHIDYKKAPLVIQRFGDIKRLVEQTLDPMVSAYFKNVAQTRTLIELIQQRSDIQQRAGSEMKTKFEAYNLELQEVLIGTPTSAPNDKAIETILTQLRARQIAEEQIATFGQQQKAAVKERELREAAAKAQQQQSLTESEIAITIQENQGKAEYQRSLQKSAEIRVLAEAEAEKAARIGIGQAIATEEQVRAYGGPKFQVAQQVMNRFAEAIEQAGVDVVPKIVVGGQGPGGGGTGGSSLLEALLAIVLSDRLGDGTRSETSAAPELEQL
ncbi:MAG TPA: SPFH domain-containing protein, partial [Polyangiaceae bacterium]|nr:SPFH domain-containing protein [Polyangiaceae bacterium]